MIWTDLLPGLFGEHHQVSREGELLRGTAQLDGQTLAGVVAHRVQHRTGLGQGQFDTDGGMVGGAHHGQGLAIELGRAAQQFALSAHLMVFTEQALKQIGPDHGWAPSWTGWCLSERTSAASRLTTAGASGMPRRRQMSTASAQSP